MRKIFISVIVLFLVVGFVASAVARAFSDIDEDSYLMKAVSELKERLVLNGYQDGSFRPDLLISRAEFVKIVINSLAISANGANCFPDVEKQWFAVYVCAAKDSGFVKGYADSYFRPDKKISFAEAAKILILAHDFKVEETGLWYEVYVDELSEMITLPESVDAVDDLLTRGEVVEIVYSMGLRDSYINSVNNAVLELENSGGEVVADGLSLDAWQNVFLPDVPCESREDIKFTYPVVTPEDVDAIVPPGAVASGVVKPHSYFAVTPGNQVAIYAPTDMKFVRGVYAQEAQNGYSDYGLEFVVSCEFAIRFGHIDEPVATIKDLLPDEPQFNSRTDDAQIFNVEFKAGDVIGYTDGTDQANRFDFGAYYSGHKNFFVNEERFSYRLLSLHSVCPYEYFDEDVKAVYYQKFVGLGGKPMKEPKCRFATMDVLGTISGAWFKEPFDLSNPLMIEDDSIAIGLDFSGDSVRVSTTKRGEIWVPWDWPTFVDPASVTDEHCYFDDRERGIVYLRLISNTEMKVFFDEDAKVCPAAFPESGYEVYYR